MVAPPGPREMQIAKERSDRLKAEFAKKRTISGIISATFILLGVLAVAYGQPMLAFNLMIVGLIFLARAIDAQGQLKEIGLYSTKTLFPRISLLERETARSSTSDASKPN